MTDRDTAEYGLEALLRAGAEKAQCALSRSRKTELNVEAGELSLMRTTFNSGMSYKAIKDGKRGVTSSNKIDRQTIDGTVDAVLEIADASETDPAYDIADRQDAQEFNAGPDEPDLDRMYERLESFLAQAGDAFPKAILENVILDFTSSHSIFLNSNGVDFTTSRGLYSFAVMFTSRDGKKASSFNYSGYSAADLEAELMDLGTVRTLLEQSAEQLDARPIGAKFTGDVILTPDCLDDFIGFFVGNFLSDFSLISGTSIYKDSLNEMVAAPIFSLHSRPSSDDLVGGYFLTGDGFKAEDMTIIDRGRLMTFLLSQYGAKKCGKSRARNGGGAYVVEAGDQSLEEMVKTVRRGLLLCRFSGGHPSDSGDFSGIAKNSYAIEDGRIAYPIQETMISGNVAELYKSMQAVSHERVNFGSEIFPWVKAAGVVVSGK